MGPEGPVGQTVARPMTLAPGPDLRPLQPDPDQRHPSPG